MKRWSRSALSDHALLSDLAAHIARHQAAIAEILADLGEVDARELYLPAGYPSMFEYCVGKWEFSEDEAYKRIQAARAGMRFPALLDALADGKLHLTAATLLAPRLTQANAAELIATAAHKTKAQVQLILAERFPQPDLPTLLRPVATPPSGAQLVPEPVLAPTSSASGATVAVPLAQLAYRPPARSAPPTPPAKLAPLAPQRFALQVTLDAQTHELLRRAQELLGQPGPASDVAQVLKGALQHYVQRLEHGKFAATSRPRPGRQRRSEPNERYVPAAVKRAVWARDGGRCTFVGPDGHRCEARSHLEFDHARPVARGGLATAENLRVRCRAHNQFEAERVFGKALVDGRRQRAREGHNELPASGRIPTAATGQGLPQRTR